LYRGLKVYNLRLRGPIVVLLRREDRGLRNRRRWDRWWWCRCRCWRRLKLAATVCLRVKKSHEGIIPKRHLVE
jgi:hypothetical protein